MDQTTSQLVLDALRVALAGHPNEQRLYRAGKLAGLFPHRTGGEAAVQALREGWLEVSRVEERGKTRIEWVKLTPRGLSWLHNHESPRAVLAELRQELAVAQSQTPVWLSQVQSELAVFTKQIQSRIDEYLNRLAKLEERVEAALRRIDLSEPQVSPQVVALVPWSQAALRYLQRRLSSNVAGPCPLPELFQAISPDFPLLSMSDFHQGLRRLADARHLRLLPFVGDTKDFDPIYALFAGPEMLYFAEL